MKRVISAASSRGIISTPDQDSFLKNAVKSEEKYVEDLVGLIEKYQKPVYGVSLYDEDKDRTIYPVGDSSYKGLFYSTPARAVEAVAKMVGYGQFLKRQSVNAVF
ncbi:MAG: hypothetical protein RBQ72_05590 [Desulfobacterium sp.]|nr:hypothetical protein [Desulfobacterium sp.]